MCENILYAEIKFFSDQSFQIIIFSDETWIPSEHNFHYWLLNGYLFLLLQSSCVSLNIFFRIFSKLHTLLSLFPFKDFRFWFSHVLPDSVTHSSPLLLTSSMSWFISLISPHSSRFNTDSNITLAFILWWCILPWHFCSLNFISPNSCLHLSENLSFIYS